MRLHSCWLIAAWATATKALSIASPLPNSTLTVGSTFDLKWVTNKTVSPNLMVTISLLLSPSTSDVVAVLATTAEDFNSWLVSVDQAQPNTLYYLSLDDGSSDSVVGGPYYFTNSTSLLTTPQPNGILAPSAPSASPATSESSKTLEPSYQTVPITTPKPTMSANLNNTSTNNSGASSDKPASSSTAIPTYAIVLLSVGPPMIIVLVGLDQTPQVNEITLANNNSPLTHDQKMPVPINDLTAPYHYSPRTRDQEMPAPVIGLTAPYHHSPRTRDQDITAPVNGLPLSYYQSPNTWDQGGLATAHELAPPYYQAPNSRDQDDLPTVNGSTPANYHSPNTPGTEDFSSGYPPAQQLNTNMPTYPMPMPMPMPTPKPHSSDYQV
ncbi:hypothetical protein INT43_005909 [Umbelopsis isabellina]|uniref:Uncharacterized protein n=1 Tax=Mortierella isabellina TaxID=91625 RepID=A0A8H7UAX5_MORIS|nr:hypothetical protein INT43_005909 [Umbelopsis isabellina]